MSDKEINTKTDIENESSEPGVIPEFSINSEGIERQISGIVKDKTHEIENRSMSFPRVKNYVSEDDSGLKWRHPKKKESDIDSTESIFKRIPYVSRTARIKGENNKYIREINNVEKLDPIMEIKTKESEGPYTCDIVFSFDTTGSMSSVIKSLRENLSETIQKLFEEVPGIRIGIIVHGDYCDFPNMCWKVNLSRDFDIINDFVNNAPDTSGGDYPECYELVLKSAVDFNWESEVRVLVVIGDATPHEVGSEIRAKNIKGIDSILNIDWREELKNLKEKKVTIFSCHALPERNKDAISFYYDMSNETGGYYFCLDDLQSFKEYMIAICLKAADGAENIELLKERQEELKKEMEEYKKHEEEKEKIKREIEELKKMSQLDKHAEKKSLELEENLKEFENIEKESGLSERVESAKKDYQSITSAFCDLSTYNAFSESVDTVAKSIRKAKNKKSKMEDYEENLYRSSSSFEQNKYNNNPQDNIKFKSFVRTLSTPNKINTNNRPKLNNNWTCDSCHQNNIYLRDHCANCDNPRKD